MPTTTLDLPDDGHEHHDPDADAGRWLVLAATALAAIGLATVLVWWWRRGGAKRAIRELAEEGAVALADMAVGELLGA